MREKTLAPIMDEWDHIYHVVSIQKKIPHRFGENRLMEIDRNMTGIFHSYLDGYLPFPINLREELG